jgi:hypothetical protein
LGILLYNAPPIIGLGSTGGFQYELAIAVFCTTRLSLSAAGDDVSTVAHHRAYLSRISIIIVSLATFLSRRNWRPLQAVTC